MERVKVKESLNFCNAAVFYDYKDVGITFGLNQVRKCIFNTFYKTISYTRILLSLCINDDIILKINCGDIENIIETIHDLKENMIYMLSFEKFLRDGQHTITTVEDSILSAFVENNNE